MDIKRPVIDLARAHLVRLIASPYVAGKGVESGVRSRAVFFRGKVPD